MNVIKAMELRKSTRGYLDKEVSKELLMEIVEASLKSPSSTNIQPWKLYIATGEALEYIKNANEEAFLKNMDEDLIDPELSGVYKERRKDLAVELFKLLDIKREDKDKRNEWYRNGFRYFEAPVAIIVTTDKGLAKTEFPYLSCGMVVQSLCLACEEKGLGTCISKQGATYHKALIEKLGISENEEIVTSIAVGYEDIEHPANKLKSERVTIEEGASFVGF